MAKLTQCEKILKAMIDNPKVKSWKASDFQSGKYFVGYEASARMSDLIRKYPFLFKVDRVGRFRTLEMDFKHNKKLIKQMKKEFDL